MSELELDSNLGMDILDMNIEQLADLKAFKPWPAGTHKARVDWEVIQGKHPKTGKAMPYPQISFAHVEVKELANTEDVPPEADSKITFRFIPVTKAGEVNEFAQGGLKQIVAVLATVFGGATPRETLDASKGAEVDLTVRVKAAKDDPEMLNNVIKNIVISE